MPSCSGASSRIRAHLRRERGAPGVAEIAIGAARLNLRSEQLQSDGQLLEMSANELELLRYLVAHRGEVLSREMLLRDVWGHRAEIETRTVDNFIMRLRKKIEPDPAQPRYLLTVHGSGYKLVDQQSG